MPTGAKQLLQWLDKNKVQYSAVAHRVVYTAYDAAATLHVQPSVVGKTLVLKTEPGLFLVVVAADRNLVLPKLKKLMKVAFQKMGATKTAKSLSFVPEAVIKRSVTGGIGAVAAFGPLYELPTFVDRGLLGQSKLYLPSGAFDSSILISGAQYRKAVQPIEGSFTVKKTGLQKIAPKKKAKPAKKGKKGKKGQKKPVKKAKRKK